MRLLVRAWDRVRDRDGDGDRDRVRVRIRDQVRDGDRASDQPQSHLIYPSDLSYLSFQVEEGRHSPIGWP